ncbi:transcriptional regulator [Streptomyces sulfonofaciens]|uniref:Transcriptional regulator n=1 Tax=Streptomyces sulfonofaciens TaxID=68272 RepID=A0A919GNV6_9ACTN|nr:FCD domain-containing protein [Streptomyces sulfonofaciens]GHH87498.1 transcriptional regulator [Streptomyces sulfonofaciens]
MAGSCDRPTPGAALALDAPALHGIRRLSALETVRARIALAVDLGLLAPGERLPGAAEIAAALGVGEITVRRALVSLCEEGVLERRRGRSGGTLVARRPATGTVGAVDTYRADAEAVHRLIDHRLALECGIAHLAAVESDEAALRPLDDLVREMDRAAGWAQFHGCDERFHLAVAAMTGAPSITGPYGAVLRDLYRYYLPYPREALLRSNREHRELVEALRRGDAAAAGEIARRHVQTLHRTMFVGLLDGR